MQQLEGQIKSSGKCPLCKGNTSYTTKTTKAHVSYHYTRFFCDCGKMCVSRDTGKIHQKATPMCRKFKLINEVCPDRLGRFKELKCPWSRESWTKADQEKTMAIKPVPDKEKNLRSYKIPKLISDKEERSLPSAETKETACSKSTIDLDNTPMPTLHEMKSLKVVISNCNTNCTTSDNSANSKNNGSGEVAEHVDRWATDDFDSNEEYLRKKEVIIKKTEGRLAKLKLLVRDLELSILNMKSELVQYLLDLQK